MYKAHDLLQKLGVSHASNDEVVEICKNNNAVGAKLTGGGAGGCCICLCDTKENALKIQDELKRERIFIMDGYSLGYANIALVKYWGKKSKDPVLPYNPNISLRLDNLLSKTKIEKSLSNEDEFYINDEKQGPEEVNKMIKFISKFTPVDREKICIKSYNTVPTAAGLSSSSSGTMALVLACNEYFKLNKSTQEMVEIAKEGSGSSCRSFINLQHG